GLVDADDAHAGEHVGLRAGVGYGAVVAGHRGAHLAGGPVHDVGQALDEDRDTARAVTLVHDGLPVGPARLLTGAALARTLDVVVGHRGLLGLLDRVEQRGVTGRVPASHPRRHLDVLDQLGEHLAALGVVRRLLVLGRRPF